MTDSTKGCTVNTVDINGSRIIYWHRELPPFDADAVAEHSIEATSSRVPGTLVHRDELWGRCYENLMAHAVSRLEQEVVRLAQVAGAELNQGKSASSDQIGLVTFSFSFLFLLAFCSFSRRSYDTYMTLRIWSQAAS